jgi:hypothetical protein
MDIPVQYVSAFIMGMKAFGRGYKTIEDDPYFLTTLLKDDAFQQSADEAKLQWENGYTLASTTKNNVSGDEELGIEIDTS